MAPPNLYAVADEGNTDIRKITLIPQGPSHLILWSVSTFVITCFNR